VSGIQFLAATRYATITYQNEKLSSWSSISK